MEIFKLFGRILIDSSDAESSVQKTESKALKLADALGKGITTAAKWGAGLVTAAAGAATAVVGSLLKIDEATTEYRENMGKLTTAWEASGGSADLAKQAYEGLYGVIGDQDAATEAAQLMAGLAHSTEDVAAWTNIAAGVSGKFGDALPIEGLIEAANETAKVGQVTGTLADALNWVGISEDAFNEKLAACGSEQERNQLITQTLTDAYQSSTEAFKKNNAEVLSARAAQAKLDEAMGKLGGAVSSVKTQLLSEFAPAIADIVSAFVDLTQGVDGADVALQDSIQNMVDNIVTKLPDFLSFGVDIIVAIAKGIVSNLPYLVAQLPKIIFSIGEGLLDLGTELYSVGEELFGQLFSGLQAKWESVSSWVSAKVSWLMDKLTFWDNGQDKMSSGGFSHASGLAYVPYDNYPINAHRGEVLLNANDASTLLDGMRSIMAAGVNAVGSMGSGPIRVEVPININGREFSRAIIDDLRMVQKSNPEVVNA